MASTEQTHSEKRTCSVCGAELAESDPTGLCPKCLLNAGRGSASVTEPDGTKVLSGAPTQSRSVPRVGERLGHYQIIRPLGQGGMGAVFEADDLETGRRVALKVLAHAFDSPEARARFFREGRLAASINHPNSVYVFGTEEIEGTPVIAMELVPGGTLRDRVAESGPSSVREAVDAVLQIIAGLESAQSIGVLHRDVKPSNCFVDADGKVKIGDFGLSISMRLSTEPSLTVSGAFIGTPAYSAPEQLRGDELTVHSDIYAVGVTLYHLLTGRLPFEGANPVQLLATVLERRPDSPARWRSHLPKDLCRIVLRCLEKDRAERFRNYDKLREVLLPYASSSPTPATLGRRLAAGAVDAALVGSVQFLSTAFWLGGWQAVIRPDVYGNQRLIFAFLTNLLGVSLYYGLLEGVRGASLGKSICGMRVVGLHRDLPGLGRAWLRALIFTLLPLLPGVLFSWLSRNPGFAYYAQTWGTAVSLSPLVIIALLFLSARRRNGYAGLHELVTGTRVVLRAAHAARPALSVAEERPPNTDTLPRIGPYHVLDTLAQANDEALFLAFDTQLLRSVWIRRSTPGIEPVNPTLRQLGRPGRLRWLNGRRDPAEAWDAYAALTGEPLLSLIAAKPGWGQIRFWLLDLAEELRAAEQDGSLPATLTLERVWITADGQAKLLDFPVPGTDERDRDPSGPTTAQAFLLQVMVSALQGRLIGTEEMGDEGPPMPLALHTRELLEDLRADTQLVDLVPRIREALLRPATVTRACRLGVLAGCLAVSLFGMIICGIGIGLLQRTLSKHPQYAVLRTCLDHMRRLDRQIEAGRLDLAVTRDALEVYVAGRFGSTVTNAAIWDSYTAVMVLTLPNRQKIEAIVAKYPHPTSEEVAATRVEVEAYFNGPLDEAVVTPLSGVDPLLMALGFGYSWTVLFVVLPCWIASLLFRGGAVFHLSGTVVVDEEGSLASRRRVLWRNVITWFPFVVFPAPVYWFAPSVQGRWLMLGLIIGVAVFALAPALLSWRSLQDRLARTHLVTR